MQGAETPVAIELVIAIDTSASVDRREFTLQLNGLAQAFRDPDVIRAVENLGRLGAAVTVIQFGGAGDTKVSIPWTHIEGARDAKAVSYLLSLVRRWHTASETSIGSAIGDGMALIASNHYDGQRRVIDISGDGRHNGSADLNAARTAARTAGIVINGLPIDAEDQTLSAYYQSEVIAGAGAFIQPADGFDDFARAIREKLIRELQPPES